MQERLPVLPDGLGVNKRDKTRWKTSVTPLLAEWSPWEAAGRELTQLSERMAMADGSDSSQDGAGQIQKMAKGASFWKNKLSSSKSGGKE